MAVDGYLNFDTKLDTSGLNGGLAQVNTTVAKSIEKVKNQLKTFAKTAAVAFSTYAITNFGKECIELGSDLAEVQNVVDVTFPAMTKQVDKWAKSAANSFGLSETMAKQYVGTFGSMAEAFGFTEKEAYDMSTTLTGLAGDVASFYNIRQDEAYTKLKSVFSGETETLKDLGIVMTQTALDSYALANGYGKTTAKMTEAEKVTLRYKFVQDQLANATGDFARTQDSWANQTRILQLRLDSLKATLGQGLINVFSPLLKNLNSFIEKLDVATEKFKSFTEQVFGYSSATDNSANSASSEMTDLADETKSANSALATTSKKTKEIKDNLQGFDRLNVMSLDNLLPDEVDVITTDHMQDGAVKTLKIADAAVTQSKLSADLKSSISSIANKADKADVDTALATKADKATTIDGYGITDAYTKATVKLLLAGKLDAMSFDNEPTLNSPCYLTSGTVYNALLVKADKTALATKYDSSNVEVGKGELTPAQAIYDGYKGSFNYSKIGKTVTVALNITTLVAGKNYVQFAGLPFMAMTASRLSSIVAYTTANKLVNIRLDGSWLYISSPDTTFADGEKINVIVTYIIG